MAIEVLAASFSKAAILKILKAKRGTKSSLAAMMKSLGVKVLTQSQVDRLAYMSKKKEICVYRKIASSDSRLTRLTGKRSFSELVGKNQQGLIRYVVVLGPAKGGPKSVPGHHRPSGGTGPVPGEGMSAKDRQKQLKMADRLKRRAEEGADPSRPPAGFRRTEDQLQRMQEIETMLGTIEDWCSGLAPHQVEQVIRMMTKRLGFKAGRKPKKPNGPRPGGGRGTGGKYPKKPPISKGVAGKGKSAKSKSTRGKSAS